MVRRLSAALLLLAVLTPLRADDPPPVRALLVVGGCCHDYAKQKELLTKGISARANVSWVISYDPSTKTTPLNPVYQKDDWAKGFDVVVHDECTSDMTDMTAVQRILKPHREGLPGVVLHCGIHSYRTEGYPKATAWFEFTGLASTRHGQQEPIAVNFTDKEHPITKGMKDWKTVKEELYNNSNGKLLETAHPLVRGQQTEQVGKEKKERTSDYVVAWTNTYNGKAKVFATTLGHNNETVADEKYLDLVARGLLWSVGKLDEKHLKPAKKVLLETAEPK